MTANKTTTKTSLAVLEGRNAGHVHGTLIIEIAGRAVPHLGFFGPDDVCLNTWLVELCNVVNRLAVTAGEYTFDEGEQEQPAFTFARLGDDIAFSINESLLGGGAADPEWQDVRFSYRHRPLRPLDDQFAFRDPDAGPNGASCAWSATPCLFELRQGVQRCGLSEWRGRPSRRAAERVCERLVSQPDIQSEGSLLTTATGEAFQPVRLYYSIPGRPMVTRILLGLRCVAEDESGQRLVWLYQHEATALSFGGFRTHAELPAEIHPVVLGEFRFPEKDRMVLALRSFERAIEAAKFFGPILGSKVRLVRARVLNRWLDASEGALGPEPLDKLLDANVIRIDPKDPADAFHRAMVGKRTPEEKQRAVAAHVQERRHRDVPLVEDFPLHPEEETADFRDLRTVLQLRTMRAYEHWKGNTKVTLADILHGLVEGKFVPTL